MAYGQCSHTPVVGQKNKSTNALTHCLHCSTWMPRPNKCHTADGDPSAGYCVLRLTKGPVWLVTTYLTKGPATNNISKMRARITLVCVHLCARLQDCVCSCVHMHLHACTCVHICLQDCVCSCVHMHVCEVCVPRSVDNIECSSSGVLLFSLRQGLSLGHQSQQLARLTG